MAQYIDKDALVAEIGIRKEINKYRDTPDGLFEDKVILSFIDTLEVKEVEEWKKFSTNEKMIKEDYVSFETVKLLKEKGFDDEYTNAFYDKTGNLYFIDLLSDLSKHPNNDTDIAASTLYVAMKWLREVHNLLIVIDKGENFYAWQLEDNENGDYIGEVVGECSSYEEACEESIKYCLENLI